MRMGLSRDKNRKRKKITRSSVMKTLPIYICMCINTWSGQKS